MKALKQHFRATLGWTGVAILLAFPLFTVSGAVDIFLKLGDIRGESVDDKHKDEIDVLAWNWGMSQSGTIIGGGGGGTGKASIQDLSITKWTDRASPAIMLNLLRGSRIADATLVVRKAGEKPFEYLRIDLKDIIVTSISNGGSGGENRLTEHVTLNFAEFRFTYTPVKPDGTADAQVSVGWNILANAER